MNQLTMKTVDLNQRSDEWLTWRSQGITASDMPIILGLSPYKTPWRLWAEKTGRVNPPDLSKNPNVLRGIRLEDKIRRITEEKLQTLLLPVCGESSQYPIIRASFDGLDKDNKVYEFKCPSKNVFKDVLENGKTSKTFLLYESQVLTQCLVSGNRQGVLIFYIEDQKPIEFIVELTDEWETRIIEAAHDFWACIINNSAPEIDYEKDHYIPTIGNESFIWQAKAENWVSLQKKAQKLEEELAQIKAERKSVEKRLIEEMGNFKLADLSGVKITRFEKAGTIDYKKFLETKFSDQFVSDELESFRRLPSFQSRFSLSNDELINAEENDLTFAEEKVAFF